MNVNLEEEGRWRLTAACSVSSFDVTDKGRTKSTEDCREEKRRISGGETKRANGSRTTSRRIQLVQNVGGGKSESGADVNNIYRRY